MMSKCGKNKKKGTQATGMDLSLSRHKARWNRFVLYNGKKKNMDKLAF